MTTATRKTGAGFLLGEIDLESLKTPEQLSEEQRMLRETTRKFVEAEVTPRFEELEALKPELLKDLLKKLGELGLCMIDVPQEYGGLGLDFISSIQVPEILNWAGGFQVSHSVQTVIGALPILYFGSEELKQKYLTRIATAELITAYALTEPGSGSDALAAKTTAVLSKDGKNWILNGSKQFISNGGLADVFIVFAQVDGKHFSAFVVDKDASGFMVGAEEHKMGIRSSSTTTLSFTDTPVPKENLIGEIGWGGKIALNVLNVGRLKLGVAAIGAAKEALEEAVRYAIQRRQFGRSISEFGIIREKIAEMAVRTYAGESTMYRTTGSVDEAVAAGRAEGGATGPAMMAALREFNVECAIEKVHGSEVQAFCVDEAVQVHGGYGFIEEYKVARLYRDARISRLYEGTNEINRMQIAGDVLKRAASGALGFDSANGGSSRDCGALSGVADQVANGKKLVAGLIHLIQQGAGVDKRGENQELLQRLADIIVAVYGAESAMGRALRARHDGSEHADLFEAMTRVYAANVAMVILRSAREAMSFLSHDASERRELESLATAPAVDVIPLRRLVAKAMIEREGRWFH